MLGQALGLPLTMTAFAFIGVAVTSATVLIYGEAIADPVKLIQKFDSAIVILFAMLVIFVAQLTTNMAANVVSPSNDFSNLNPKRISYVDGRFDNGGHRDFDDAVAIDEFDERVYFHMADRLFRFDGRDCRNFDLRLLDFAKAEIRISRRYLKPTGIYSYANGFNWRAIVALIVAIAPVVPGFLRAATTPGGQVQNPNFFDTLYVYAWFVTFAIGFGVYLILMQVFSPQETQKN